MYILTRGVTGTCSALSNQNLIKLLPMVRAQDARWVNANTAKEKVACLLSRGCENRVVDSWVTLYNKCTL